MSINNSINYIGPATSVLPWMAWEYFVWAQGNDAWSQSTGLNDPPYSGPSQDYGTVQLRIPQSGTYRFSVSYQTNFNKGILTLVINGVTTNIDCYDSGSGGASFSWEQDLDVGEYDVDLNNLTKNPSSSDYQLLLNGDGLLVSYIVPPSP